MTPAGDGPGTGVPADIASRLVDLADAGELFVAVFDADDVHRWVNGHYARTFDVPPDGGVSWAEMMRRNHRAGIGVRVVTDDIDAWITSVRSRRGKQPFRTIESDLVDGRWLLITETTRPGGWMLVVGVDITPLRQDTRALRHARDLALRDALTDTLTSIGNRRFALARMDDELRDWRDAPDGRAPPVLALLDLDHFKRINDAYGHATGDAVLQRFARLVAGAIRRDDACARLGGEEFALLLPRTTSADAAEIVDRVLTRTRATPLREREVAPLAVTASAGLAAARRDDTVASWMSRADAALYAAKAGGRDRLLIAPD